MTQPVRISAENLQFPEGPIAMPDGSVIVVEIKSGDLTRVDAKGKLTRVAHLGGGPNGAAIGPDGKCYVCNNGGFDWHVDPVVGTRPSAQAKNYSGGRIERVDLDTGKVEVLYDHGPNGPLSGPNDIVFDRHGGFWFSDIGKIRTRDMDRGGLYYARADGSMIKEVSYPMVSPNGVGLSSDEKTLYVVESITARLWAFDLSAPGEIVRKPSPSPNGGTMLYAAPTFQAYDSLGLDSAGNVCIAAPLAGGIAVISPQGRALDFVMMPDIMTTNICFGGPKLRTAYITLSGTGRLGAMEWPRPGLPLNYLNTR